MRVLILITGLGACSGSFAEELDIKEKLVAALYEGREYFPLPMTPNWCKLNGVFHDTRTGWKAGTSEDTHGSRCEFHFTNVKLIPINVSYSEVKRNAVPAEIVSRPFYYKNCGPTYKIENDNVQVTTREGQSLTTSTTITTGKNVQWTSGVTFELFGVGVSGANSRTVTFSSDNREEKKIDYSVDVTVTQGLAGNVVEANTEREFRFLKTLSKDYIEFVGSAHANADVSLQLVPILGGPASGVFPIGTLKELTTSKSLPTVDLKGQLWTVKGEHLRREDYVTKLAPGDCEKTAK